MSSWKLNVLHNEAIRQRALDASILGFVLLGSEDSVKEVFNIHGEYTKGFYENQLDALRQAVEKK